MACTRVFVGNVAGRPPASVLENHFGACGSIASVDVKPGYAFIEFNDVLSAETAIATMHGSELNGRLLAVKFGEKRGYKPLNKDAPPNDPTNIGELLECAGSPELSAILGEAVMCQWRGDGKTAGQLYTHGFHPYLALMEPRAAALLLSTIPEGGAVLDPFCGSGACVLQVMLAGRAAYGSDVSSLAVGIARHHCWQPSAVQLDEFKRCVIVVAEALAEAGLEEPVAFGGGTGTAGEVKRALNEEARRVEGEAWRGVAGAARKGVAGMARRNVDAARNDTGDNSWNNVEAWEKVRAVVTAVCILERVPDEMASALRFVVSAEEQAVWPAWRKPLGLAKRFYKTAVRYEERLRELMRDLPADTVSAEVRVADARDLSAHGPIAGVITSPPYPGVYDYLAQAGHQGGLATHEFEQAQRGAKASAVVSVDEKAEREVEEAGPWQEIGSQGQCNADPGAFGQCWQTDTEAWLGSACALLPVGGRIAVLIGDGAGVNTLDSMTEAAARLTVAMQQRGELEQLRVVASASVAETATRPWTGRRRRAYRREHAILLEKVGSNS